MRGGGDKGKFTISKSRQSTKGHVGGGGGGEGIDLRQRRGVQAYLPVREGICSGMESICRVVLWTWT